MPENPLDQLPPIHLPEPISFWPPAMGWWFLLGLLIVLGIIAVRLLLKRRQRNRLRRLALQELELYWQRYQKNNDAVQYVLSVNRLLKQFVMQQYPDKNLHVLSGVKWLEGLNDLSPQSGINADSAAVLLTIYSKHIEYDKQSVSTLNPLLMRWFKGLILVS